MALSLTVGSRVSVLGHGLGVIDVDNDDGTWNITFDDETEANIPTADIEASPETHADPSDMMNMTFGKEDSSALVIWLHGCTDTPDGWHTMLSARCPYLLPHMRAVLPCAPVQFL